MPALPPPPPTALAVHWGHVTQQSVAAAIAAALALVAVTAVRRTIGRPSLVRSLWLELPLVALALAAAGMYGRELGFIQMLPGPVLPWTVGVAFAFYWLAVWWPLRVAWHSRTLRQRSTTGGRLTLGVAATLVLGALWSCFVEPQRLEVEPRTVRLREVGPREIRVAHVSDLQMVAATSRDDGVIEAVTAFEPHVILLTGDYIAMSSAPEPSIRDVRGVLSRLRASHGIFATTSDSDTEAQRLRIFQDLPIRYLLNKSATVKIDGLTVRVGGLNHFVPRFSRTAGDAQPEELFLLGCHTPDLAEEACRLIPTADAFLCGHTHGGQIQVPFFGPILTFCENTTRRVAAGGIFETSTGIPLIVTRGVGMEGSYAPRFRFWCRPHIFLLTLRGEPTDGDAVPPERQ
ncbi:MAG: hypothetical protein AAF628_21590 [Planctomycetota bacterium]